MILKGKNLIKLHNCFSCHEVFKNNSFKFYPKIKNQYLNYLIFSLTQYQNFLYRKSIIMKSQSQNISFIDAKKIFFFLNNVF